MGYKKKDIKYYLEQFCRYTNEGKNIIRETKLGVLKNNLEYVKEYANKQGIDIKELCNRYGYYFVEKALKQEQQLYCISAQMIISPNGKFQKNGRI